MKIPRLLRPLLAAAVFPAVLATSASAAPNLIVATDIGGDPDDSQSMRRLMLYADEFNLLGLIASSAGVPGQITPVTTRPDVIHDIIDDYETARPNLVTYSAAYPTAAHLRTLVKSGNPNRGTAYIGAAHDTAGSNFIISQVDAATGKVAISIWGGATDVAQALYRVRANRSVAATDAFVAKLIVYAIADQDSFSGGTATVGWMLSNFPQLRLIVTGPTGTDTHLSLGRGMYQNDSLTGYSDPNPVQLVETADIPLNQLSWLQTNVLNNHGPLGAGYAVANQNPASTNNTQGVKEGDTPSWFYFLANGLHDPEQPTHGGWGGRFQFVSGNYYTDGKDAHWSGNTSTAVRQKWTVARWRRAYQNDFAARMDRCVGAAANRPPVAVLNSDATKAVLAVTAAPGATVNLSAAGSTAGDAGQSLAYKWWIYREAGSYPNAVTLANSTSSSASFTMPADSAGTALHVILEVTDNGTPPLTSYRRLIVTASATAPTPNLVAHWKFDETSGTAAADSSGNGHTATLFNGPIWTTGGSLAFDGSNDYAQAANTSALNLVKNFTLAAWIKPAAVTGATRTLLAKATDTSDKQYQLTLNSAGALQFDYEKSGNNYALSGGTAQAGVWQHAAVTVDSARNIKLYLDAALVASGSAPADVSTTSQPVVIGRTGGLDDVRVYSSALTATQIAELADTLSGADFQESGGQVSIEAENYTSSALRTDPNGLAWSTSTWNPAYSGTGYVTTALPSGGNVAATWANGAELAYTIQFTTPGSYHVWLRRWSVNSADNAGFVGFDGAALSDNDNVDSAFGAWTWVKLATTTISPGLRTFQLRRCEANYRVDRIVITTSSATPN